MTPPFAFLDAAQGAFMELVRNILLIAGGFLVGYLAGWVLGWAVGRWVFRRQHTTGLQAVGRPVGGVLGALIVALLVLTGRGKPVGDGGDGKGTTATDPNGKAAPAEVDPKKSTKDLPKPPDTKPADVILTVTLYGGSRAVGQQYYQYDAEAGLRTLEGLQDAILARKGREKGKVSIAIRLPPDPNDRPGDPRVQTRLTEWANAQGLDVTFPASK
ncbi:MAG: hypothetical protein C0501_29115 [Isosphaera sp.]|nr:hypothetical protein [Isosphaera sp.]